jgi:glycosyltransferase involved in cell wall biosynthesis
MKLVAIARVRNEIDIIEAFVRHHAHHFNKLIVLDDGSSDGTLQLLEKLKEIFPSLVVLRRPTIGYLQQQQMSLLLKMAVDRFGADWVAPLDADEFIETEAGTTLAHVLASRRPALFGMQWSNFVWKPEQERSDELNPVKRLRYRLPPRADYTKVLVHNSLVSRWTELTVGSHSLLSDGSPLPSQTIPEVRLCHFPIRSVAQYVNKVAIGYLQYLATPDWNRQDGFHYICPFNELVDRDLSGFETRMMQDSLLFGIEEAERPTSHASPSEEPLNYLGGPLDFTPPGSGVLSNILSYSRLLAEEIAHQKKMLSDFELIQAEAALLRKRISALELALITAQEESARQSRKLQSRTFRAISGIHGQLQSARRQAARAANALSRLRATWT